MFYRFRNGSFIEANSYQEAQEKMIQQISEEVEDKKGWHKCTCLGFGHHFDCPQHLRFNPDPDAIPF
jgi:hypothetical protein